MSEREADLLRTFNQSALERLTKSGRDYTESHYNYLPQVAEVALIHLADVSRLREERDALQRLADVTGNYLLWAPREKGHAAAHARLWDAYREYEATLAASPVSSSTGKDETG